MSERVEESDEFESESESDDLEVDVRGFFFLSDSGFDFFFLLSLILGSSFGFLLSLLLVSSFGLLFLFRCLVRAMDFLMQSVLQKNF